MIEFRSIQKTYPDGTVALSDLNLVVPSHKIVALVGSSGCGKTTLLRLVNRMESPTRGQVLIDDVDVATVDPVPLRRSIGYVMQHGGLLPHRKVLENVITVLLLNKTPKAQARTRGMELLATVGLTADIANKYPAQLSGGQQQRVGVARALATDPNILLMDEPFGAVDPIVRLELQEELLELQRKLAKTILFVTHDVDEALRLGDEIVLLQQGGRIAQQGTPAEILARPASEFVANFVGIRHGKRSLHIESVAGTDVLVDATGRTVGVLDSRPVSTPEKTPTPFS